jgi:hypothetical protein
MRKLIAAGLMLFPALALAQVRVEVGLPTFRFEAAPPMVVVSPGVQVVEDYDEEVFFSDGYYWCRRDDRWFRSRDYRGHWVYVEQRRVPGRLYSIPSGRYRRWHHEERREMRRERWEDRRERHEDRREEHEREKHHGEGWKHHHDD